MQTYKQITETYTENIGLQATIQTHTKAKNRHSQRVKTYRQTENMYIRNERTQMDRQKKGGNEPQSELVIATVSNNSLWPKKS